jgi:hypothetical protein
LKNNFLQGQKLYSFLGTNFYSDPQQLLQNSATSKTYENILSGQLGYTVNLMLMKKLWNIHHIGPHTNRSPVISCQHR